MKLPMPYAPLSLSEVHRRRAMRVEANRLADIDLTDIELAEDAETD